MKISIVAILSSILFSYSLFGQEKSEDFELTLSSPREHNSALHLVGAKKTGDGYLIFDKETIRGPGGYRYFIEVYNDDMKFVKNIDISEKVDEKDYRILEVLSYGDNFLLVTSRVFKKEKREEIYLQKIEGGNEVTVGKRIKIHEDEYYSRRLKSSYRLSVSPNDKYLLVQVIPPFLKKKEQNLSLILLDNELNIKWKEKNVVIDGESDSGENAFSIVNILVNDFGDVYILGKPYNNRNPFIILSGGDRMSFSENNENHNEIYKLRDGKFTGKPIVLNKDGLRAMDIQLGKDNTLHCLGYFTDEPKNKKKYIEGVASYVIDRDLNGITSENLTKFDDKFQLVGLKGKVLEKAQAKIDKDKDVNSFNNLVTERIIQHEDGSLTLVGELQYTETYTTTSGDGSTNTHTVYLYRNLVISTINSDGEVLSNTMIRKLSSFKRPTPIHNLIFSANGDFVRIYLKSRGGFDDPDLDKNKKDLFLVVRTINEEGEHNEKYLFDFSEHPDHKKDNLGNLGYSIVLPNKDVIILSAHSKKEYEFLRIRPVN